MPTTPNLAVLCVAAGDPPQLSVVTLPDGDDTPAPAQPGKARALVAVSCSVFDVGDRLVLQGRALPHREEPFVPGRDAGGHVVAIDGDSDLRVGDAVVFTRACGAWAVRQHIDVERLVRVPPGLPLADAVAAMPSHVTAQHALFDRAGLRAGERVLVLGVRGAVGRAAVQLAQRCGAHVFGLERLSDTGTLRLSDYGNGTVIEGSIAHLRQELGELLGEAGADVVVDPIGDVFTEPALRNLAWGGRLLVIGFAAGMVPSLPTNLLLSGASLLGVNRAALAEREPQAYARVLARTLEALVQGALPARPLERLPVHEIARLWSLRATLPPERALVLDFDAAPGAAQPAS